MYLTFLKKLLLVFMFIDLMVLLLKEKIYQNNKYCYLLVCISFVQSFIIIVIIIVIRPCYVSLDIAFANELVSNLTVAQKRTRKC